MYSTRRVGRYTKHETSELLRMFGEGYSVYKICRNLNRSQKSIRNSLIRLGKIEGVITPIRYARNVKTSVVEENFISRFWNNITYGFILTFLTMLFVVNPNFNILEVILFNIFYAF